MKKKIKQYKIDDPIYNAKLSIVTGDNDEIKKYLMSNGFSDYGKVYSAKYLFNDKYRVIILNERDIATVTHELLHFCFEVFDQRGIPISHENDEAMAYYFEMILNMVLKLKIVKNK